MIRSAGILLAGVCDVDPVTSFFTWLTCGGLSAFGVNPDHMGTDMIASFLSPMGTVGTPGACSTFLEALVGSTCVTSQLWQMTEAAGYPILAITIGARFLKTLADSNFTMSPSWALAEPLLRAVLAAAAIHASYDVMALAHINADSLAHLMYNKMADVGGADPAGGIFAASGLSPNLLVTLIQWLYTVYLLILMVGSLIGYQTCIVLAPLMIPFWVYNGHATLWMWFARTALGGLVLPIVLGVGWGIEVALTHQLDGTLLATGAAGAVPGVGVPFLLKAVAVAVVQILIIVAGAWFMGRLIKGTTGEFFQHSGPLTPVFMMATAAALGSRGAMYVAPRGMLMRGASRLAGASARFRNFMPSGLVDGAEKLLGRQAAMAAYAHKAMSGSPPLALAVAPDMDPRAINNTVDARVKAAHGKWEAGDLLALGRIAGEMSPGNFDELAANSLLRHGADKQAELGLSAWDLQRKHGVDLDSPNDPRVKAGIAHIQNILDANPNYQWLNEAAGEQAKNLHVRQNIPNPPWLNP